MKMTLQEAGVLLALEVLWRIDDAVHRTHYISTAELQLLEACLCVALRGRTTYPRIVNTLARIVNEVDRNSLEEEDAIKFAEFQRHMIQRCKRYGITGIT